MRRVEIVRRPTAAERDRSTQFVDEVAAELGRHPLSDHLRLDLLAGGASGFVQVVVLDHVDGVDTVVALAQLSGVHDGRVLEAFVAPGATGATELERDAVDTALDAYRADGGGSVTWWVDDADDTIRAAAADQGLTQSRELFEMRRPLPHPERASVTTRDFVPGIDDDAWLAVNNRAFAGHGEQDGWTNATLALRMAEPWFDPAGFRLYEADGELLGFCWTKVHTDQHPPIGEIYVIAIDPSAHGRGLGRELTLAGLDSLADRGIASASLYVDAANSAAIRLYRRLGFTSYRTRTAFSGRLAAA